MKYRIPVLKINRYFGSPTVVVVFKEENIDGFVVTLSSNHYSFLFTEAKKMAEEQMNKAKQLAGEKCAIQ